MLIRKTPVNGTPKDPMWAVQINNDPTRWHARDFLQHQAVARVAVTFFGQGVFIVRQIGEDRFAIAKRDGRKEMALGIASCKRA